MLRYDIIRRKQAGIAEHFKDVSSLLTEKCRKRDKDYTTIFYDVALVSPSVSRRVNINDPESLEDTLLWYPTSGRRGIRYYHEIGSKKAFDLIRRAKVGAVHFDLITPFSPEEIGGFIVTDYKDKLVGTFEMNIFQSFDLIPNRNRSMDKAIINALRRRYSCNSCSKESCVGCKQETVIKSKRW